jgi:nitronate monooxygenase
MAGATTSELVTAVSNAGGLGSVGAARTDPYELRSTIRRIRELTDRPFGVNVFAWPPFEADADPKAALRALRPLYEKVGLEAPKEVRAPFDPSSLLERQLAVIVEERVPVFSFTFGIPPLDDVRGAGAVIAGTATTPDEAAALERAGVDLVVAQGSEAGGHRGTFLHDFEDGLIGSLALVPAVVDAVDVPVLAAGGIMDGRGIAAALALGADGAQVGTAFLDCPESALGRVERELIESDPSTTVTDRLTGRPARAIRTRLADELADVEPLPFPLQAAATGPVSRAASAQGYQDLASSSPARACSGRASSRPRTSSLRSSGRRRRCSRRSRARVGPWVGSTRPTVARSTSRRRSGPRPRPGSTGTSRGSASSTTRVRRSTGGSPARG